MSSEACVVKGFRFAGVRAGLKASGRAKDLGLIVADGPVAAAGVFTTNRVKAAPVIVAQQHLRAGRLKAVVVNSGSANCFTGARGLQLALRSCALVGGEVGCPPIMVAPCSTGVIGHLYDFDKFKRGVRKAVGLLDGGRLEDFARAIMTTDTRPKIASAKLRIGGAELTIAGAAKGAGMIAPKMATMLAFIVTDAAVPAAVLRAIAKELLPSTFNAITVDGDTSTNDALILMASGATGGKLFSRRLEQFGRAVTSVARSLARQLVYDGEGASKLVTVEVRGARSLRDAERVARQIANSPLVKTAFYGGDPNVGRIVMAAGASGAAIDPSRLELAVGGITVASGGSLLGGALAAAAAAMRQREFSVRLNLRLGAASASILTTDLTPQYVRINSAYTT